MEKRRKIAGLDIIIVNSFNFEMISKGCCGYLLGERVVRGLGCELQLGVGNREE